MGLYRSFRSFRKQRLRPLRLNPGERRTILVGVAVTVILTALSPLVPRLLEGQPLEVDTEEPTGPVPRPSPPGAGPGRPTGHPPGGMIAEHLRGGSVRAGEQHTPAPRVPTSTRKFAGAGFTTPARPHHLPQAGAAVRSERPLPRSTFPSGVEDTTAPPLGDAGAEAEAAPHSATE